MIPAVTHGARIPERPRKLLRGEHNRICVVVMGVVLIEHHKRHTPRHFEPGAAARYGYKARRPSYKRWKTSEAARRRAAKEGFQLVDQDLVLTGRSKRRMLGPGGMGNLDVRSSGYKFTGGFELRFDWGKFGAHGYYEPGHVGGSRRPFKQRLAPGKLPVRPEVTPEIMLREISRWADDETAWAAQEFASRYWQKAEAVRGTRTVGAP